MVYVERLAISNSFFQSLFSLNSFHPLIYIAPWLKTSIEPLIHSFTYLLILKMFIVY